MRTTRVVLRPQLYDLSLAAGVQYSTGTNGADFPRSSAILARDGFARRQLARLGDRLVYSNGILLLGFFAALLVIVFRGQTDRLIPLHAVGVFLSFTLSQTGMVRHWLRALWDQWGGVTPLVILESPYRSLVEPLFTYIEQVQQERPDQLVTVVLPQFVASHWWELLLHHNTAHVLNLILTRLKGVVVTEVRYSVQ